MIENVKMIIRIMIREFWLVFLGASTNLSLVENI